ncbi:N-acetylmuramoyl-L-alanine amidase family protein [Clostridium paraputrificum]|uniref:N-acetylmuramoyl-L-alanine amidase family protein n=1 Tax=Clostridium paraputrificum TaxID=29363 RepID=UPI003D327BA1
MKRTKKVISLVLLYIILNIVVAPVSDDKTAWATENIPSYEKIEEGYLHQVTKYKDKYIANQRKGPHEMGVFYFDGSQKNILDYKVMLGNITENKVMLDSDYNRAVFDISTGKANPRDELISIYENINNKLSEKYGQYSYYLDLEAKNLSDARWFKFISKNSGIVDEYGNIITLVEDSVGVMGLELTEDKVYIWRDQPVMGLQVYDRKTGKLLVNSIAPTDIVPSFSKVIGDNIITCRYIDENRYDIVSLRLENNEWIIDKTLVTINNNINEAKGISTDKNGDIWIVNEGYVEKLENNEFIKKFKVNKSLNCITVYDDKHMLVWSLDEGIYTNIDVKDVVKEGWIKESSIWYFYKNGEKQKGWIYEEGKWYYLNKDNGSMVTGLNKIDSRQYVFNNSGEMQIGWAKADDTYYYADKSGALTTGWIKDGESWYYLNPVDYKMTTGFATIDGHRYSFLSWGPMETGWILDGNDYYYGKSSGELVKGWIYDSGKWYFIKDDYKMATGFAIDGNKKYYLNKWGQMQTGWIKVDGNYYYGKSSGELVKGWIEMGSDWYFMNDDYIMETGWIIDANKKYYLKSWGAMQKGWLRYEDKWYYLTGSGASATGWLEVDGKKYYFDQNGVMLSNTTVDGVQLGTDGSAK